MLIVQAADVLIDEATKDRCASAITSIIRSSAVGWSQENITVRFLNRRCMSSIPNRMLPASVILIF